MTQSAPHVENINANSGGPCGGEAVPPPRDLGRFAGTPAAAAAGRARAGRLRQARDRQRPAAHQRRSSDACSATATSAGSRPCRRSTAGSAQIVDALRQTGELDDTILVFSLRQRHLPGPAPDPGRQGPRLRGGRAPAARRSGCRRSTRAARASPATIDEMTANIDYAPTFLDWAGSKTCPEVGDCRVMDGRSWLPLFDPKEGSFPADRPLATELDLNKDSVQPGRGISCAYRGRARRRYLFVRHTSLPDLATGQCEPTDVRELYDHVKDPFELQNLLPAAAGLAGRAARGAALAAHRRAPRLRRDRGPRPRARERPVLPLAAGLADHPVGDLVAVEAVALGVRSGRSPRRRRTGSRCARPAP